MCGICGQLTFDGKQPDKTLVKNMSGVLRHRGPDDQGLFFDSQIGLGHRRLNIIDLKKGHQPMSNEDGSIRIVLNGEVYNYIELRKELISKGHTFRTKSDTEVLIHLYEDMGEGFLKRLEGMFAFAIWDKRKRRLFIARDRFGIKPLHYFLDKHCLIFASEIKSILQYKHLDRSINNSALNQYFTYLYILENNTIFKNIHKLAPGHYLICENGNVRLTKYWDAEFNTFSGNSEKYYCENIRAKLEESVRLSLRSDVPVGIFLSGGIDSSGIAAMAKKMRPGIKSFSVSFEEKSHSEADFSRLVARHFALKHYELTVTKEDAFRSVTKIASILDEPFADSSCIPTYCISRFAAKKVKVVLTGDGGDELFAGYPWHNNSAGDHMHRPAESYSKPIFTKKDLLKLYKFDYTETENSCNTQPDALETKRLGALNRRLYFDIKTFLPSDMLVKVDRMAMLNSLEARPAMLNLDFAEFCLNIPQRLKFHRGIRKYILKKAMADILPERIIKRAKMGFSIPINIWLWEKNKLSAMVRDTLLDRKTGRRGFFNHKIIETMLTEHEHLVRLHGHRIWSLFMFELWCRNFLDNNTDER